MKILRNVAVVATLVSLFAFASCGSTTQAAAKSNAEAAKEEIKEAAQNAVDATVNAAVTETTEAIESAADTAVNAVAN
ncbi:MAG: hypothetical protein K6B43_01145 [Treponema sp.]|nr:hypothetical protein [Treponema sp.]